MLRAWRQTKHSQFLYLDATPLDTLWKQATSRLSIWLVSIGEGATGCFRRILRQRPHQLCNRAPEFLLEAYRLRKPCTALLNFPSVRGRLPPPQWTYENLLRNRA